MLLFLFCMVLELLVLESPDDGVPYFFVIPYEAIVISTLFNFSTVLIVLMILLLLFVEFGVDVWARVNDSLDELLEEEKLVTRLL